MIILYVTCNTDIHLNGQDSRVIWTAPPQYSPDDPGTTAHLFWLLAAFQRAFLHECTQNLQDLRTS